MKALVCSVILYVCASMVFAVTIEEENFNAGWGNWTTYNVLGAQIWDRNNTYGIGSTACARMSGYSGGALDNQDWLISPAMNFDNYTGETLTFSNTYKYSGPVLQLLVSTDYNGNDNPTNFTWTDITARANWSAGEFVWDTSGVIDISDFNGSAVYIAFTYLSSTVDGASTWEVDEIGIAGTIIGSEPTNVIYLVSPPSALTAPGVDGAITTRSISNGTAEIGYGKSQDGSGWSWQAAAVSGTGPWDGAATVSIPSPGTYFYGARWDIGGMTYYGWNADGQTNKISLAAEYQWIVTNPTPPSTALIITKVVDGTLLGGTPKAVEIANTSETALDLSAYSFALYSNGDMQPTYTETLTGTIPAKSVKTLCSSFLDGQSNYYQIWGDFPDIITDVCRGNGNDWYALLDASSEAILDIAGPVGISSNIYLDSYMLRKDRILTANPLFTVDEWIIPGIDALEGLSAQAISNAIPTMGVYGQIPEPAFLGMLLFACAALSRRGHKR